MKLLRIGYRSRSKPGLTQEDLTAILEQARSNNRRAGITGILVHTNGTFFQILEGWTDQLIPLYDKIRLDTRHTDVQTLFEDVTLSRIFRGWTMNYCELEQRPPLKAAVESLGMLDNRSLEGKMTLKQILSYFDAYYRSETEFRAAGQSVTR